MSKSIIIIFASLFVKSNFYENNLLCCVVLRSELFEMFVCFEDVVTRTKIPW